MPGSDSGPGQPISRPAEARRWALVTGASAGIGAEFCRQLAGQGYSLVLVARRRERLEQLAAALQGEHAVECRVLALDLADTGASRAIEASLAESSIHVEFLVNNAGYGVPGPLTASTWETHSDSLNVMLNSVVELTRRLLPGMQQRRRGFIVNVASLAGFMPGSAGHTLYGATKAFLIRFSESLAMENLATGVVVSALCPGYTYSEFHDVTGSRETVSKIPGWLWMDADEVVRYGIDSVTRHSPRVVAVPGRTNRLIAMLLTKLPYRLVLAITQRQARKWRKQT